MSSFEDADTILDNWDTTGKVAEIIKQAWVYQIIVFMFVAVLFTAVVIFETRTRRSWRTQLWSLLFLCFLVSIPWEWVHLYRKAFAAKQAKMEKDIPKHCRPDHELHPWESLKLWMQGYFAFSDDACIKYQESLLVDPIWEVSPLKAVSAAIASAIAQPLEHMAETIGKSFRALFKEVPIQWQPFVFMAVIVIIMLAMVIINSKPALPGNAQANIQQLQQKVQNVEEAQEPDMEKIQVDLNKIYQALKKECGKKGLKRRDQEDEGPPLDIRDGLCMEEERPVGENSASFGSRPL